MNRRYLASAMILALLVSCAVWSRLVGEGDGVVSRFNHQLHIEDAGLECTDCHEQATSGAEAGMPALEACYGCHDEEEPGEAFSPWLSTKSISDPAEPLERPVVLASYADVRFSHSDHLSRGAQCADCHGELASATVIARDVLPVMADCVSCHRASSSECATCHEKIRADEPPSSHESGWERTHGRMLRGIGAGDEARCRYCHEENACSACHRAQAPADHNQNWEFRAHGHAASIDRDRCAVCHQEAACIECHSSVEPRTHISGWGAPFERHCTTCHDPLEATDCAACHQAAPQHTELPLPGDHIVGSDCRSCHINLKHRDDGGDCERCHR